MTPAEYLRLRLEHTLQHLQQATRLIYVVNGAALAMLYFVAQLESYPYRRGTLGCILIVLGLINWAHALFFMRLAGFYHKFDDDLRANLTRKIRKTPPPSFPPVGASWIYASIHAVIGVLFLASAIFLWSVSEWP
jgi:hypothetical protein